MSIGPHMYAVELTLSWRRLWTVLKSERPNHHVHPLSVSGFTSSRVLGQSYYYRGFHTHLRPSSANWRVHDPFARELMLSAFIGRTTSSC